MKEEFTKKDSMPKKCSDICSRFFEHTTDFDALVATFEAILYESDLWMDYFHFFKEAHLNGCYDEVFTSWKSWAKSRPPKMWSCQAFIWESTDIMYTKWNELDNKWITWLIANIKK